MRQLRQSTLRFQQVFSTRQEDAEPEALTKQKQRWYFAISVSVFLDRGAWEEVSVDTDIWLKSFYFVKFC